MPQAFPSCVVTFSSEDPNHPASNLLNRDTYRKWKCKEAGEKEAFVVLKFEKAITFTAVDIGNESSAMVEVMVGRSGSADIKYEVLLSSSVLMSPAESRNQTNPCVVRNYSAPSFDRETASQKWDLVKVVVSQIFNKNVQFGLTFVKFTAVPDPDEPQKIGVFGMRKPLGFMDDDDDASQPSRIGAMFAKSMATKSSIKGATSDSTEQHSTSAAIREVTKAISGAAQLSTEGKVKEILQQPRLDCSSPGMNSIKKQSYDLSQKGGSPSGSKSTNGQSDKLPNRNTLRVADTLLEKKKTNQNPNTPDRGSPKSFHSSPNNRTGSGLIKTKVDNQGPNGQLNFSSNKANREVSLGTENNLVEREKKHSRPGSNGQTDVNSTSVSSTLPPKPTGKSRKDKKPFGKLLDGVIFVMSGFENPYRKEVRDKAIEMGARYRGDWNSTCTHLLCAFVNTPKFREVRNSGNGVIVKKEWIERSYEARCRFPWRRFCLDRNDRGEESEDEIHALDQDAEDEEILDRPVGISNGSYGNQGNSSRVESIDVDAKKETDSQSGEEDGEGSCPGKKNTRKRILVVDSSDEEESRKAYDADTDVDEEDPPNISSVTKKAKSDFEPVEEEVTERRSNYDVDEGSADFFENSIFFLSMPNGDLLNQRRQIEQIISKRKGTIENELTEGVEYYITTPEEDWNEEFSEALSDNPNLSFVRWNWILDCEKAEKMTPFNRFMLTPS